MKSIMWLPFIWCYGDYLTHLNLDIAVDMRTIHILLDKVHFSTKKLILILFLNEIIRCGYLLEEPQQATSYEYPYML